MADYYGRNKKVLLQGTIGRPHFIALFEDKMYVSSQWGPQKTGRVFVASRMNGSHVMTLEKDVHLAQGRWLSIHCRDGYQGCISRCKYYIVGCVRCCNLPSKATASRA